MEAILDLGMLVCFIGGPWLVLRVAMRRPQRGSLHQRHLRGQNPYHEGTHWRALCAIPLYRCEVI
jgi:hypothetical protein